MPSNVNYKFDKITLPKFKMNFNEQYLDIDEPYDEELDALDALRRIGEPESLSPYTHMNIRRILSDNAIKDMMVEEDRKFMNAVRSATP